MVKFLCMGCTSIYFNEWEKNALRASEKNMNFGKKRKGYESKYRDNETVDLSGVKKSKAV